MKFKIGKEAKIGILVVFIIGFFIWGYNFLKGKNLLSPTRSYYVLYERVGGLQESSHVIMSGYRIGFVDDIRFTDDLKNLRVKLAIDKRFEFPEGTVARIISSDIMGTKAVDIIPGSGTARIEAGGTLIPEIEPALMEEINIQILPLKLRAEEMMSSLDSVLVIFQAILDQDFRESFAQSIDNIGGIVSNLQRSVYAVDTLLTDEQSRFNRILANLESITGNIAGSNDDVSRIVNNFAAISDSLSQSEILSAVNNLNEVLGGMNKMFEEINRGEGSLGKLISDEELYSNLENATRSLDLLLTDLKERPGRYVNFSVFGKRRE